MLTNDPAHLAGGDWDVKADTSTDARINDSHAADIGLIATVEEISRSWARNSSVFEVKTYLKELENRAYENRVPPLGEEMTLVATKNCLRPLSAASLYHLASADRHADRGITAKRVQLHPNGPLFLIF